MNSFINVKFVNNPIKCVTFQGTFDNNTAHKLCYFFDKQQINLNEGLWCVAIHDVLVINELESLQVVFDIKTDLITSFEPDLVTICIMQL